LRPAGAPLDRQAREREAKKTKARIVEMEKRIAEKERAVKDLEAQMAAPASTTHAPRPKRPRTTTRP
jgi:hypothetical protein